ncbi:hypothetical protein CD149_10235 [Staphylococcus condimenti]|uniref:Uncharacterized protein n=1 Tax=Staphylococcus condimenti TaxID=70255 RepID=A0AB37H8I6_9STAP|nr:hypothetical protein [Staphylococcus condimenti]AMY05240.1 hypothetical protein A4G25_04525 [Staphylococcus condimenti]PNZ58430.1 hypothetical protein CD149_10235 [Staphylococcus condimenti]QQS82955.1 hypothetical protein I6J05_01155 [Staphylococcus condimenti]QRP94610.1 hypothetical protein I6J35_07870 [Staphylococcus condimenti]VEG64833.1 Uncharacterised protein [Staphylococcus condimenti]
MSDERRYELLKHTVSPTEESRKKIALDFFNLDKDIIKLDKEELLKVSLDSKGRVSTWTITEKGNKYIEEFEVN